MNPIKVIHFTDNLRGGGKERQLVELLKGLSSQREIIPELAIMSHNIHYTGVNKLGVKKHYVVRKNKKDPRAFIKFYNLCKEIEPDIIHTWSSMTSIYALPIAKLLRVKLINGMIRAAPSRLKLFGPYWIRSKITFPFSDVVVSNSYAGLESYGVRSNKGICIYNGLDINRLESIGSKEAEKKKNNIITKYVVGMVASFSDFKDYDTFISAANRILQKRDDVTFVTVGDGENVERCRKLVKAQFKNKVKFLGKQKNVEPIVNMFDIGVLATDTRHHGEGISNSIMEYMILGKPVIATDHGGTKELVLNGKTGLLVKPLDAEDMCLKIDQLLNNNEYASALGSAGKERICKHFSFDKMIDSYISLYKMVVSDSYDKISLDIEC